MICRSSSECSLSSNLTCRNNVCDCTDTNLYWNFDTYRCGNKYIKLKICIINAMMNMKFLN